jgi:hypothetical protein
MPPPLVSISQAPLTKTDAQLVAEACGRAAKALGLSRDELSAVVGQAPHQHRPHRPGSQHPGRGAGAGLGRERAAII